MASTEQSESAKLDVVTILVVFEGEVSDIVVLISNWIFFIKEKEKLTGEL